MAGDPFGLLLRQRVVFLGGEVRTIPLSRLPPSAYGNDVRRDNCRTGA